LECDYCCCVNFIDFFSSFMKLHSVFLTDVLTIDTLLMTVAIPVSYQVITSANKDGDTEVIQTFISEPTYGFFLWSMITDIIFVIFLKAFFCSDNIPQIFLFYVFLKVVINLGLFYKFIKLIEQYAIDPENRITRNLMRTIQEIIESNDV